MAFKRLYLLWLLILAAVAFKPPVIVKTFDLKIYDLLIRYSAPNQPDPRIAIVGIDQKSLKQFGRWPWSRDLIAQMTEKLRLYGAKVIALDMTFSTHTDAGYATLLDKLDLSIRDAGIKSAYPGFYEEFSEIRKNVSKDQALADSIRRAGNVVTGIIFQDVREATQVASSSSANSQATIKPFSVKLVRRAPDSANAHIWFKVYGVEVNVPVIQEAGFATGFLNTWTDQDGVIRNQPVIMEHQGEFYPSLALASVMVYTGTKNSATIYFTHGVLEGIDLGGNLVEIDPFGRIYIRYMGPDLTFDVISAADVVTEPEDSQKMRKAIGGKLVFIGATASSVYDLRVTPLGITAGVEIQANTAATLLNGNPVTKYGWQHIYDVILALALGLALYVALPRMSVFKGVSLGFAALAGILLFNYYNFAVNSLWLNSVAPAMAVIVGFIGITVNQFLSEQRSRRFIKDAFSRYLSPKIINQIIANPNILKLGGEKRVMTAFFSDVAGFTSISEQLEPEELVGLLNDYLSRMTDIIHEFDGTVDKFEGDAIIAFWGAPIPVEDHAGLCVASALAMQKMIVDTTPVWKEKWGATLNTRMGINTGSMVVGNMGSKDRMDYTIMGDSVNLAARMESANKFYGSKILVSEFTHDRIKERFLTREVDLARVAGKKKAIRLYEVIDEADSATMAQRELVKMFDEALKTFRNHDFTEAKGMFEKVDKYSGGKDIAVRLYIHRCSELIAYPPQPDWDTVYDLAK